MRTTLRTIGYSALSASVETVCVAPDRVAAFWPHARGYIVAALERCGDWSETSIFEALQSERALLWVRTDGERICGAGATQLLDARHGLTCNIIVYGGACDDWQAAFAPIETYAKAEGCAAIRIQGRAGWKRIFPDYDLSWITLEKRLS